MKKPLFALALLLLAGARWNAQAQEKPVPPFELRWQGRDVALDAKAQRDLTEQAVRLVESSNFHSGDGDSLEIFKRPEALAEIQHRYREAARGNYAAVNFSAPRKIKTIGGEITVAEIIVSLNREDFADDLFTVNETNGVIGHAKYLGNDCIEFLRTVKQDLAGAPR